MKREFFELFIVLGIAFLEYLLLEKYFGLRSMLKKVTKHYYIYFFVAIFIATIIGIIIKWLLSEAKYYYIINQIPTGTIIFLISDYSKKNIN